MHFVEVAIKVPLQRTFDYKVEQLLHSPELKPGMRVRVPFGSQKKVSVSVCVRPTTASNIVFLSASSAAQKIEHGKKSCFFLGTIC